MKKLMRKITSLLMAIFMILQVMLPAFSSTSRAEDENPNMIKGLEEIKNDTDLNISIKKSQEIYDKKKTKKDENKFSIALSMPDDVSKVRLIKRNDLSLFEDKHYDTNEQASKEYWHIKDMLNDQGLDIDLEIINDDQGYKILTKEDYENLEKNKEKSPYGQNYSYIDFKIMDDFDFNKKGNQKLLNEDKLVFNLEFFKNTSPDPNFNLYEKDEEGNLEIKKEGDIFALVCDDKKSLYDTKNFKEEYDSLQALKEEKTKQAQEQKDKQEKEKAEKQEEEIAKKQAQEQKDKKETKKEENKKESKTEIKVSSGEISSDKKENEKQEEKDNNNKEENKTPIREENEQEVSSKKENEKELSSIKEDKKEKTQTEKRGFFRNFRSLLFGEERVPTPVGQGQDELNLDGKKFTILTRFNTSNAGGSIQPYQYFDIILDEKLTVNDPSTLKDIRYNGRVIAKPTYIKDENKIRYNIQGTIPENISVLLKISVDYNKDKIKKLDNDGTFTVTNKVSGMGIVNPPRDLVPQKVDKNGNLAGSIIEPGRGDVPELIESDDKSYKVDMDAYGIPDVVDGELKGFNWKATVLSTKDLQGLDLSVNFTTVKGSGLGEIRNLTLDGANVTATSNKLKDHTGIVDSINYKPNKNTKELNFTFYTPVTNKQESYMLDLNAMANGKVGSKRVVGRQGYPKEKVELLTPSRVGMNNRTSIFGEFPNPTQARWTITDQVSTGDEGKLPLESRQLGGGQSISSGKVAVYGVDTKKGSQTYGQMIQVGSDETLTSIPEKEKNPVNPQPVGSIVAYEYTTDLSEQKKSSIGGVVISKTQDIRVGQSWGLDGGINMPAQTIKAVDPKKQEGQEGYELGRINLEKGEDKKSNRRFTIQDVKVWDIDSNGNATRIQPKLKQDLPREETIDGKTYQYAENYNYYKTDLDEYYLHNIAKEKTEEKFGSFTLKKIGPEGEPVENASFNLFRGAEAVTNKEGEAEFKNISQGTYYLTETKAPKGYKLAEDTTIIVDKNGRVRATGKDASQTGDETATQYFKDEKYPLFMNLMSYATKGQKGEVTTYIYLKPDEGGGTNQNTRLNITGYNSISEIEVYDVNPANRSRLRQAMDIQSGVENNINGPTLNQPNPNPIKGENNVRESYTGKTGYQIKIPHVRFGTNWGFLVKVTGTPSSNDGKISYDWLVDNNAPGNNSRIQKTITPADPNVVNKTTVTVKDKKFETKPIEVIKVTSKKETLGGATFVLKNPDNGEILKTVKSVSVEGKDKGKVDFGKMPPGDYIIEEIAGPEGYIESQLVFDVHVDEASQVTYKPRFKNGVGTPVAGVDYWIEDEVVADEKTKVDVITVDQSMTLSENNPGETGTQEGVWEAYRYESYTYKAKIKLASSEPKKRFEIQFDPNLDFTQYVNQFPEIKNNGQVIAKPYFNYDTNLLTYVFTEASGSGEVIFDLVIDGVIPSKFYAKNAGEYDFTNVVAPGQKDKVNGNQVDTVHVKAFYDDYDSHPNGNSPSQAYYFRDVFKGEDGNWYVKAIAYYNPKANLVGDVRRAARTLSFNWMSTNWSPTNIVTWAGNGNEPAFALQNVKVYSVQPTLNRYKIKTNEPYMPLSMGIRPENDPSIYRLELNQNIGKDYVYNRQGAIALTFDPNEIHSTGALIDSRPLKIDIPAISNNNEGYVIDQTFKVTDLNKFRTMFRAFVMQNSSDKKNSLKSAFASKVNVNEATAEQNKKEIPKFYKQKVMMANEEYVPTSFKIRKYNEADTSKTLEGAIFTLTNNDTGKTITKKTSKDGYLTFDKLQPGVYRLKETEAPKGFIKSDKRWLVNVAKDGVVTITEVGFNSDGKSIIGKELVLDVANKPEGQDFVVYKKGDQGQALAGAKFVIKRKDGENYTEVGTGESDTSGIVKFKNSTGADLKLTDGIYLLEETEAPTGYKKLDKKWVLVVGKNKVEVHDYIEGPKEETSSKANKSLLIEKGTHWVDVAKRSPAKFNGLTDPRWRGYINNSPYPYKMGTRIVGINKTGKYVIQRFVINPEAKHMGPSKVQIHKQPLNENNMDWYSGTEAYKIFQLDKAVTENVGDIKLENYVAKELNLTAKKVKKQGETPERMEFDLPETDKPIIIDVKVPYKSESAGVGLGMDYWENVGTENEKVYWKPDFYESVEDIPVGDKVTSNTQAGNIVGAYISEGSLDVKNERKRHKFEFTKVRETSLDGLSGATFKLTGPKPQTETKWGKSDDKGKVSFEGLLPGTYKLEEHGAPQGYESSNTDWTVTILEDGKVYIKDNNPTNTVPNKDPEAQWQKVDVTNTKKENKSDSVREEYKQTADKKIKTHIVRINKATKRIRQVYVLNRLTENLLDPTLELHSYPEKWDITDKNTNIMSVTEVGKDASPENLGKIGANVQYSTEIISKNNHSRLVIKPKISGEKTIAVVIETDLKDSTDIGGIGTGMDYDNRGNKYWGAEKYASLNDFDLEQVEHPTVDKNTNLIIDGKDRSNDAQNLLRSANEENQTLLKKENGIIARNYAFRSMDNDVTDLSTPLSRLKARSTSLNSFRSGGLEISDNLFGGPVGAGNLSQTSYNIDSSDANITVNAGDVNTTDGTRNINISVSPKEGTNTGSTNGKNLQYVFMIDRSRDQALNIKTADTPTIDKNINKFLTDLAEKAKNTNTSVDVTFIEYSKNGSRVLGNYNQNLVDLYNSANTFTYNMKTRTFGDRNNVTAKDILGSLGISSRTNVTNKDKDDGSEVLNRNIGSYYNQIVGNGKKYDKKYVLNIANFDAATATYYLENKYNPNSTKKYYAADNNWIFRDTTKPAQDRFESYVLHISQKAGNTGYESYMSTNSGTLRYEKDTATTTNGIYTYKDFLESNLIKNEYFQSSGQVEEYLVKNAKIDINLNTNIRLAENPSADNGNISYTSDGFSINNINLKKGQKLNLSYKIGLDSNAQSNQDYPIHRTMLYTPNNSNPVNLDNNLATRRNLDYYFVTLIANNGSGQTTRKSVNKGENYSLPQCDFAPPSGQEFDYWLVYGQKHQPGDSIQITEDTNVIAFWKNKSVTPSKVTITFDGNGGEWHMDPVTVDKGSTYYLPGCSFTPPANSTFDYWLVNGERKNPGDPISVNDNTKVTAIWKSTGTPQPKKYDITTRVDGGHGSVGVSPSQQEEGNDVTITVTPDSGYEIERVTWNGTDITSRFTNSNSTTYTMVAGKVEVVAKFKAKQASIPKHSVSIIGDPLRSIQAKPAKSQLGNVEVGERVDVKVTMNSPKYVFNGIVVKYADGGQVVPVVKTGPTSGYFIMEDADVTVSANTQYILRNNYAINIADTENGFVEADRVIAPRDQVVTLTPRPNQGYKLQSYKVTDAGGKEITVTDNQFTMPASAVTISATFVPEGTGPNPGGGSQVLPDSPELGYLIYDPSNPNKIIKKDAKITNRLAGLELKIYKKNINGRTLEGGEFKLFKTEADYNTEDKNLKPITAVSGLDGRILFKDKDNQPVKLQKGYYVLEEIKPPVGYKKASSKWKIEVKDDGGRMHATYFGPSQTPSQYLLSKESKLQDDSTGTNLAIRTASKITHIDPDSKTFVQRVIIDLRGYNNTDKVNVQITPKYKRVEKDRAGKEPYTIEEGLKTAYRTTYKISNPDKILKTDDILGYYDLSKKGVSMVNTARWRPFDWGFDEDQLNLDPGEVYFIDIEGYYDESLVSGMAVNEKDVNGNPVAPHKNKKILPEDLAKLQMDIKFYEGERNFYQAVYNEKTKEIEWKTFPKASYQAGAAAIANTKPKGWSDEFYNKRYQNWLGLEGGKILPALDSATPIKTLSTSADISKLYTTDKPEDKLDIPKEGLDIINDEETYNITFSKHGRDGEKSEGWESNGKKVTENRLEGAIFKLQQYIQNDYVDVPGSYVSSAFNGFFGFRGLKPGRYRLMEVEAPKGYRPIRDAILYMTVAYEKPKTNVETGDITPGRGKITLEYDNGNGIIEYNPAATSVEHGQLVDYVTSATAKNMGKIINEKPGKGKVRINKKDGEGKPLEGAKFRLIRLGSDADSDSPENKEGVYFATSENLTETATATVAKKDAVEPEVKNGKVLTLDPVRVGATKIFGETISDATVTVTFPENKTVTVKTPNSGKFTVDVPDGLVLKENDTITASIDEKGVAIFDKLPIGNYILEEIKSPDGYKSNGQKWRFTVGGEGLDPYVNDTSTGGKDLTDKISLIGNPEIRVQKTLDNDKTNTTNAVYPHKAQSIGITAKFNVPLKQEINPGDYFKVKLSDSIDLYGINKDKPLGSLDIFADGVGTIAKAKYDKETNTITYTFTEYAKTYTLTEFKTNLATWINLDKFKKSTKNVEVGIGLGNKVSNSKYYDVEYDIPSETSRHPYQYTEYYRYWYGTDYQTYNYWHNLTGKITEMDKETGEFTQYYYINRMRDEGYPNWTFRYNPYSSDEKNTKKLNYANIRIMKLNNNNDTNIGKSMPESFALDINKDTNLTEIYNQRFDRMGATNFNFSKDKNSGSSSTDSYIVEVKGKIPLSEINDFHSVGSIIVGGRTIAARWDLARFADNKAEASAQLIIQAINPKNEIKFRKTDYKGTSLEGAKFALYKKNGESWQEVKDSEQTTKADGLVSYEKLAPGEYALFEKKAPEGYNKIEGHIEEFSVGQNGEITRKVEKHKTSGQAGSSNSGSKEEKINEPVGNEPIDVINYKNVEFIKLDEEDHSKLEGAKFKVLYKKEEKDKYDYYKVYEKSSEGKSIEKDMEVESGEDGKFKLEKIYKDGYYALEETKAPHGYTKVPGLIREFKLENGRVFVKEKDPIKSSFYKGAKGKITSQILEVDKKNKTFKQRIVINPKHEQLSIPEANSFLRIIENGWDINPNAQEASDRKIKVALIQKDEKIADESSKEGEQKQRNKSVDDLKEKDFNEYGAISHMQIGDNVGSRYSLKEIIGNKNETTDTIVVEYTGTLQEENKAVEQKADVILGLEVIDEVNYTLDINSLAGKGPVWVDINKSNINTIEVENKKVFLPRTNGLGAWIGFTIIGLLLMLLAVYYYNRKKNKEAKTQQVK